VDDQITVVEQAIDPPEGSLYLQALRCLSQ
ncbi:hypothetical protein A2U01_0098560, partial [Trifolium medium]|nr:hypothetical protein [Trifolium medium]